MARRVRRVKKVKRVRVGAVKPPQTDAAQGVQGGQALGGGGAGPDDDPDGPPTMRGTRTVGGKRRSGGKRRAGAGSADGELDVALDHEDLELDTGAGSVDGVRRRGGAGNDGFDDAGQKGREAYEAYLKGHIQEDAARFESLRSQGQRDAFDPEATPDAIERQGRLTAATHMVRLYDHWMLDEAGREGAIDKAATWLTGFSRPENVRKVLTELESKPIRDVYPLEVMLKILDTAPEKLQGVRRGAVVGVENAPAIKEGRVYAGHPVQIPVPPDVRVKGFALLGGLRPGYEFHPSATKNDQYTLLIDTPGEWEFALFGVRTQDLGKIQKELSGGVVETFKVDVQEMGRKPEQPTA